MSLAANSTKSNNLSHNFFRYYIFSCHAYFLTIVIYVSASVIYAHFCISLSLSLSFSFPFFLFFATKKLTFDLHNPQTNFTFHIHNGTIATFFFPLFLSLFFPLFILCIVLTSWSLFILLFSVFFSFFLSLPLFLYQCIFFI